ncbi:hypothetical protein Zmor_001633 [Zophobas morio]|uniref:MULE transposase domain-containing protein n=1 Tax=Zophobas morio TaxID=2755281 RepID=A0AA38IZG0_9CUCU|nr:hypothetical protein Zmor_001633 [Zophobas morio]
MLCIITRETQQSWKSRRLLFSSATNHGCYFHFRQCMRRQLQTGGQQARYDGDRDFQSFVKTIMTIALVLVEHVFKTFEIVCATADIPEEAQSIITYFENTWVGRRMPRKNPKFKHILWNFFDSIIEHYPNTNNFVEAWHRTLHNQFHAKKTSMWKFLERLLRKQSLTEFWFNQCNAGNQEPQRKKYKDKNKRLQVIVDFERKMKIKKSFLLTI